MGMMSKMGPMMSANAPARVFRGRASKNTILRDGVNDAQVKMAKRAKKLIINARGGPNPADMLGSE